MNTIKILITSFLLIIWLGISLPRAVAGDEKRDETQTRTSLVKKKNPNAAQDKNADKNLPSPESVKFKKKYDTFIDRNKDSIDDRVKSGKRESNVTKTKKPDPPEKTKEKVKKDKK